MASLLRVAARPSALPVAARAVLSRGLSYSYPQSLLNVPETRVTVLPNGMRVATEDNKSETATVGVWIDAGSRFETPKNNGVAHFLEHLIFKGTAKRSGADIELMTENLGAHLNAYTSREVTSYYAKVFKKDLPFAVDVLSDILQNASLSEAAIAAERHTITSELEWVERDLPQEVMLDHLHAVAYQNHPLGMTILGSREQIASISRADLVEYMKQHYSASRMVLVGAGGVNHEELVALAQKSFTSLPSSQPKPASPKPRFIGAEMRNRDDSQDAAHIVLAVEGCAHSSPDYFPLLVAQALIGSWDRALGGGKNVSSRLAQRVADSHIANSFTSFSTSYSDTGMFGIHIVSPDRMRLDDVVYYIQQEWVRMCLDVTDAEVDRAKSQIKTSVLMGLDGSTMVADDIGRQLLAYGRRLTPYELDARISSVSAADVRRVASKYLYDKDPVMIGSGPIEALPDYNRVANSSSWLRV